MSPLPEGSTDILLATPVGVLSVFPKTHRQECLCYSAAHRMVSSTRADLASSGGGNAAR